MTDIKPESWEEYIKDVIHDDLHALAGHTNCEIVANTIIEKMRSELERQAAAFVAGLPEHIHISDEDLGKLDAVEIGSLTGFNSYRSQTLANWKEKGLI